MQHRLVKPVVFLACLIPAGTLIAGLFTNSLGPNPVETLTNETGEWGLRFLMLTLTVTPLRQLFRWHHLISYRRMLGLFCFFYVVLHFLVFLVFDHSFNLRSIIEDIVERPYITVGFTAFVLLIPLAVTSFKSLQRKMGRNWLLLHRLIYPIAVLGVIHFWWQVKADILEPLIYATIVAVLLSIRLVYRQRRRAGRRISKA